jgi:hypothetical protein
MFDPVLECLFKATDSTLSNLQVQREMFTKRANLWWDLPVMQPNWVEVAQKVQERWAAAIGELAREQRTALEEQFQIGRRSLESAFQPGEAKEVEELRKKSLELWQQSFDCLRQMCEAQVCDFQNAVRTWTLLLTRARVEADQQ